MANITTTLVSMPTSKLEKRQAQPTESVVHVTITRAGTVVYTQTATSYSYVQSYSTIMPSGTSTPNHPNNNSNSNSNSNNNSSHANVGAIVGGVVGGVAGLALIGLAFFLYSRSQKRKRARTNNNNTPNDYYQEPHNPGMNSLSPTPRHFVAPLEQIGKHELGDGADQKYYYANGNGYYEDIIAPYHYSGDNSVTSDSLPSTTVDTSIPYSNRHVPDSVDYPLAEERHVPNAKEDDVIIVEPPHTKD